MNTPKYDTIVAGGGPAGVAAALAAARGGCRVLLIERYGFLGGMATAAGVNPFAGNCYVNPDTGAAGDILAGVFAEVLARLRERRAVERYLFDPRQPRFYDAFDTPQLVMVYDELLAEAGVDVLLHSHLLDAKVAGDRVASIRVATRGGIEPLAARQYIDCTGDGALAAAAGAAFDVGRPADGLCQPCSMMFRMAGVDKVPLLAEGLFAARARVAEMFRAARDAGRIEFPFKHNVQFYDYPRPGVLQFNATRVWKCDGLSSRSLADGEREGRRQVRVLTEWLRREVPWFATSFLDAMGPQIGVRETRRIRGLYTMTGQDIREGARFDDGIARSGYFIDIHSPDGAVDPHAKTPGRPGARPEFTAKRYYEVPFRCLQPAGLANVLVACRAISTTFEAHAATRVMATMHAVGEAAGRAAAMARRQDVCLAEVDGAAVRREIGYLDDPLGF